MSSEVSQIPNRFFTSFTTEKTLSTVHERKADGWEYLGEGCLSLCSAVFGRPPIKVSDDTYDIKGSRYWLTRVAVGLFAVATAPLLVIPGLIFLGLSKTHKVAYFATLAEAHRRDGEHTRARKWMISALKVNHMQPWLRSWVEKLNWSNGWDHNEVDSSVKTLIRFADHTGSSNLVGVCQKIFNKALFQAVREEKTDGGRAFNRFIKGLNGLPITEAKADNMSLDQAKRLKKTFPRLAKVVWDTAVQDTSNKEKDRNTTLKHLVFAAHFNEAKRAELEREIEGKLAKGDWSLKDVARTPLKTLDLSTLNPKNRGHLKLFLQLPYLEDLTIDGKSLEADDLRVLAPLAKLEKLTVKNLPDLTEEKLAELKKVLPNTVISA